MKFAFAKKFQIEFMKKLLLLISSLGLGIASFAQLSLSGTSYTQTFDGIGTNLPIGWSVDTGAKANALGSTVTLNTTAAAWSGTTGGFKNYASSDGLLISATTSDQSNSTDRALGVKQVSQTSTSFPNSDPGAAFILHIANTNGLTNFSATFKLQSLDTASHRTTTWAVDYGFGAMPTSFTATTPTGTLTTGGGGSAAFTNNNITVNFGTALDNQSGDVWIRVVALTATTGSGSRAASAIDDFNLTWTGSAVGNYKPYILSFTPANNSNNQPLNTSLKIVFDRGISKGAGNINIKNKTTGAMQNIAASTANVSVLNDTATITGLTLALGNSYYVLVDSNAFDTASKNCYGIYDSTAWVFSTLPAPVTSISETFDAACATNQLPANWSRKNNVGNGQQWSCSLGGSPNKNLYITGYVGGTYYDNEDWLLTPPVNLSAASNPVVFFRGYQRYGVDHHLDVLYSSNYSGVGDPNLATWTNLNIDINSPADTGLWKDYSAALPTNSSMYVAFKYTSNTTVGALVRLDSVVVSGTSGILPIKGNNQLPVSVLGTSSHNSILVGFVLEKPAMITAEVYDLTGRVVYSNTTNAINGTNRISLNTPNLPSGLYIVRISNGYEYGVVKAIVE